MLRLNLSAEESKQKIKWQRLYFLFLKAEVVLFAFVLIVGIFFFAAEKILAGNIQKINQETSRIIQASSQDKNLEAKKINEKLAIVSDMQNGFISSSGILEKITALIPKGVSLSYLAINIPNKKVTLRGRAALRDDLLALEKNLKGAPFLSKVNIPLQNKLKKENIDFDDIIVELDLTKLPATNE